MIAQIVSYAGAFSAIFAAAAILIKPLREWIFGMGEIRDGLKCQLRWDMLRIYYRHRDEHKIRQYELENLILCYKAYKRLRGNSFIDKIYKEVMEWEVIS